MEVASPLTFAHSNGGSKRRFHCADAATSPALGAPSSPHHHHHSADENMDDCSHGGYGYHATKRRRKNNQDVAGTSSVMLQKENNWSISPFLSGTTVSSSQPGCHSPNSAGKFLVCLSFILVFYFNTLIHSSLDRLHHSISLLS